MMRSMNFLSLPASSLLLLLAAPTIATAEAAKTPKPAAAEHSFDKACALAPAYGFACRVLGPKDGRAKFITAFHGGVHTTYLSDNLGDCPLLPERAEMIQHLDQAARAQFPRSAGTGDHLRQPLFFSHGRSLKTLPMFRRRLHLRVVGPAVPAYCTCLRTRLPPQ